MGHQDDRLSHLNVLHQNIQEAGVAIKTADYGHLQEHLKGICPMESSDFSLTVFWETLR
jgi:hypothetical protein